MQSPSRRAGATERRGNENVTIVVPWAARALDRALAAVVVAAARHLDSSLTPDAAVKELKNRPATRAAVRDAIVARAPASAIPGGPASLASLIDGILDAWIETADAQSGGGNVFGYADKKSPHRLLHMPLAAEIPNLSASHQKFIAGRSMRDVEPSVALKPRDPWGAPIANGFGALDSGPTSSSSPPAPFGLRGVWVVAARAEAGI